MSTSSPATAFPRLFSAVVWSEAAIAPLQELQATLRGIHAQAPWRWTAIADLHLTLRFYGDASHGLADRLAARLAVDVAQTPVSMLEFTGFAAWETVGTHVLVARFRPTRVLRGLQTAAEKQARDCGLAPETRRFQPHVTLARADTAWNGEIARVKLAPFELPADEIGLWHRGLLADSPRYAAFGRYSCGFPRLVA